MLSGTALVFSGLLGAVWCIEDLSFPPGFKFGVATAAYQVEGAWNVSDKGESIWDRFTRRSPSPISDGSSGEVACDSYHLWKEDIRLVTEIGADFYRISISWSRLLPNGFSDHVSADGKKYYSDLIDGLLKNGIEPVLTLYHWDLPQCLQDLGGWSNPLISEWFADYARVAYSLYGDRVKTWITINEAWAVCDMPYFIGIFAPGVVNQVGAYICTKNVLMAHAKAWRIYDAEFKPKYHGQVSLANHPVWMEAASDDDEMTAELVREHQIGRYSHAIYSKKGGWPAAIEKAIAEYSKKQGYPWSILPAFSKDEIELVKGTYDFYGVNFYHSQLVRRAREDDQLGLWPMMETVLFNATLENHPDWPVIGQIQVYYPEGFRKLLVWLKKHYGDIPFLITENGRGTTGGLNDRDRMEFYREYLKQVLLAIKEDGVNVTGYTAWTLMDNFEWASGYESKYGLYEVDFTSPNRTRTARSSARYYASIAKSRSLDVPFNVTSNVAPKSSKPKENHTRYIVFGLIILIATVIILGAVVCCQRRDRKKLERKLQYIAVKNGEQNSDQNGTRNGIDIVTDSQGDIANGTQNGIANGTQTA